MCVSAFFLMRGMAPVRLVWRAGVGGGGGPGGGGSEWRPGTKGASKGRVVEVSSHLPFFALSLLACFSPVAKLPLPSRRTGFRHSGLIQASTPTSWANWWRVVGAGPSGRAGAGPGAGAPVVVGTGGRAPLRVAHSCSYAVLVAAYEGAVGEKGGGGSGMVNGRREACHRRRATGTSRLCFFCGGARCGRRPKTLFFACALCSFPRTGHLGHARTHARPRAPVTLTSTPAMADAKAREARALGEAVFREFLR